MNRDFWKNKKVFLTGHTGFKGSWMSLWLAHAGAIVKGYSKDLPTNPSLFQEMKLEKHMQSVIADVRDLEKLTYELTSLDPDIVIHMAAQPLVRYSYDFPVETYMTNVMGAVHLLEACRKSKSVRAILNVTSDKCYENKERLQGYKEDEPMGGHDPYSNSKGCSELVTSAYRQSFMIKEGKLLASGRAGNVIGGGDWALDRLVPDIVRSVINKQKLLIRSPNSIRPWQHVLEPISGYLTLVEKLYSEGSLFSQGYNFGPSQEDHRSVIDIINIMNSHWNNQIQVEVEDNKVYEAKLLSLDCTKAYNQLHWKPKWNLNTALRMTVEWNVRRLSNENIMNICLDQINEYEK